MVLQRTMLAVAEAELARFQVVTEAAGGICHGRTVAGSQTLCYRQLLTRLDDRSSICAMEKKDTRAEIIAAGTAMISLHGYNATGIDAVLRQVGVPKGSFYHYFGSKEEFGLAVIEHFAERYSQKLDALLRDDQVTPLNRIRNYLEGGLARLEQNQCSKGCLIGNLGQELADQNERFRARLDAIFGDWKERFAACLAEAQRTGELRAEVDAGVLAGFVLSGWEGAILRAKVMKSAQPLRDFIATLFGCVLRQG